MAGAITYVDTDSIEGSNTTFNHTGVGTGIAAADRYVGVVTQGTQSGVTAQSVTSVTVGGNAATHLLTRLGGTDAGGNRVNTSIWIVELPSGTSENISVVWQTTMFDNVVSTFALTGIDPAVFDSATDFSGASDAHTAVLSLDVPAGGVALGACSSFEATAEVWAGLTERFAELNFSTNRYTGADFTAASAEEPLAGSVTFTGTTRSMAAAAVSFAAAEEADVTAPVLSNPAATATGEATASLAVDTDEGNGTLYWVVTASSSQPSAAQIVAGQDHTGAAAADSGNQAVSGTGTQTVVGGASGLTEGTAYWAYFVQDDAATNRSNIVSDSFTTDSAPEPPSAGRWQQRGGDIRPEDARKYREYVREIEAAVAARTAQPEKTAPEPKPKQARAKKAQPDKKSVAPPEPVAALDGRVLESINRTLAKVEDRKRRELEAVAKIEDRKLRELQEDDEDILLLMA